MAGSTITRYVNTASTAGGDGTTNATTGANRAYASLNEGVTAEAAGSYSDLVTSDVDIDFNCTGGEDTAEVDITGFTTNSTHRIMVTSDLVGREPSTSYYRLRGGDWGVAVLRTQETYTIIRNMQVYVSDDFSTSAVRLHGTGANYSKVERCILKYDKTGTPYNTGIFCTNEYAYGQNNLVIGFQRGIQMAAWYLYSYFYNNTVVKCTYGLCTQSGADYQVFRYRNNLVYDCGTDYDFLAGSSTNNSDYNATDGSTSSGGSNDRTSQTFTFASSTDYGLSSSDAGAQNYGVNLYADSYYTVTNDKTNNARPSSGSFDIGFHEITSSTTALTAENILSGTPAVGNPALSLSSSGTAENILSGTPIVGNPILEAVANGVAENILTGVPIIENPALTATAAGVAENILTGNPQIENPAVEIVSRGTAENILTGNPIIENPVLSIVSTGTAENILTGSPAIENPVLSLISAGTAENILSGTPIIENPSLTLGIQAVAMNISAGAPIVGTPELAAIADAAAVNILAGNPVIENPTLQPIYNLQAESILAGTPVIGNPAITLFINAIANNILAGIPVIETPELNKVYLYCNLAGWFTGTVNLEADTVSTCDLRGDITINIPLEGKYE